MCKNKPNAYPYQRQDRLVGCAACPGLLLSALLRLNFYPDPPDLINRFRDIRIFRPALMRAQRRAARNSTGTLPLLGQI